jgi:cyanophycinase-like exopeptidase
LVLGGDLSLDFEGPAMQDFANRVRAQRPGQVLVVAAGTESGEASQELANEYAAAIDAALPAQYPVKTIAYGTWTWNPLMLIELVRSSAVVFVGGDQSLMAEPMSDIRFRTFVQFATRAVPLVMTDSAMTAVMGDWYVTDPDPGDEYQDEGIEDFKVDGVTIAAGLGIVDGAAFEPLVTYDQRWGRLYNLTAAHPDTIVFGISEITSLVLTNRTATVAGERSVIALDGRAGSYLTGGNGALTALNVLMNLYAPGDTVQ